MHEQQQTTHALTTHYLDEADTVVERVIVVDHGRIIADGTSDQLKATASGDLFTVELADPTNATAGPRSSPSRPPSTRWRPTTTRLGSASAKPTPRRCTGS